MNFSSRAEVEPQFQIAPILDIVFILLIFFVATYAVAQDEKLLDINLPASHSGKEEIHTYEEIVVNLTAQGEIFVQRQRYTLAELDSRLLRLRQFAPDPVVIIRADGACPHRHVVEVMDLCARHRVRRIYFTATPPAAEARHAP